MNAERCFGVKAKLLLTFLVFTLLILAALWVLEVVFLDDIYQSIKLNSVQSAAEKLDGMEREKISDFALAQSDSEGICFAVYDEHLNRFVSEHAGGQCVVHNISAASALRFYGATASFEDQTLLSYLPASEIMEILEQNERYQNAFPFFGGSYYSTETVKNENSYDCVLLCRVAHIAEGEEIFFMLSTKIMPVDATVQTIRFVLILMTVFLLLISVFASVILSRTISKPIVRLNEAAKRLPEGKFDSSAAKGYREAEELGRTLSLAATEISKVEELRRELIANVSHDLRTPLTLISGYSEVMRDIPGENTPENLQTVIDETQRLSALVTDMLDLSKLEAGMQKLETETIDLTEMIESILHRYEKLCRNTGLEIIFEGKEEPVFVEADSIKLSQAIYNLINNAVNYCGEDRKVIVRQIVSDRKVRFEVTDHGKGIEENKLKDIWDRYYRVDQTHARASVGTGLGLSIVKKVLELHGASFGVESQIGKGSTFWFELEREQTV